MTHFFEIYDSQGTIIATANSAREALQKYNAGTKLFPLQRIFEVGKKEISFRGLFNLANF